MVLDSDPSPTFLARVCVDLIRFEHLFIFISTFSSHLGAIFCPDGIHAPTAGPLKEHAVEETMHEREERTLVADQSATQEAETVVVDVERSALRLEPLCVPDDESHDSTYPDDIAPDTVADSHIVDVDVEDRAEKNDKANGKSPQTDTPGLDSCPSECKVLQWADVGVSELTSKQKEASDPEVEIPVVNFLIRVLVAANFCSVALFSHIVTKLNGMQEKKRLVLALQDGLSG